MVRRELQPVRNDMARHPLRVQHPHHLYRLLLLVQLDACRYYGVVSHQFVQDVGVNSKVARKGEANDGETN